MVQCRDGAADRPRDRRAEEAKKMISRKNSSDEPGSAYFWTLGVTALAVGLGVVLVAAPASARWRRSGYCTKTADLQFSACENEVKDDYFVARAICLNLLDADERDECNDEARDEQSEGKQLCREQRAARGELCEQLGEDRYDPNFDPALFDDDFDNLTNPNEYFPLAIGNVAEFESGDETIRIEVMDKTKLIDGVTCIVVNDVVSEDGVPIEDTDDWFGQRKDGTIDYCGESVRDFEVFEGDDPEEPELVEIEGSFKAGRDGDKPGMLFPGSPVVGHVFRQEWSPSNAEDAAVVLSTSYQYPSGSGLDESVPPDLAELFCSDDPCVVVGEFSPIDPGVFEHKFYGKGIGKFLEVGVGTGEVTALVACNYDDRCDDL
jgi:hypothetical protein